MDFRRMDFSLPVRRCGRVAYSKPELGRSQSAQITAKTSTRTRKLEKREAGSRVERGERLLSLSADPKGIHNEYLSFSSLLLQREMENKEETVNIYIYREEIRRYFKAWIIKRETEAMILFGHEEEVCIVHRLSRISDICFDQFSQPRLDLCAKQGQTLAAR